MTKNKANRWQFSLRAFLIAAVLLGASPWVVQRYRKWRSANLWENLEAAKSEREQVVQLWRQAYLQSKSFSDVSSRTHEQAARQEYSTARNRVVLAKKQLDEFYGVDGIKELRIVDRNGEKVLVPYKRMP